MGILGFGRDKTQEKKKEDKRARKREQIFFLTKKTTKFSAQSEITFGQLVKIIIYYQVNTIIFMSNVTATKYFTIILQIVDMTNFLLVFI